MKLIYFNARGRADLSRMIAAYGKLDLEDHRIEFQEWAALKPSKFFCLLVTLT